MRKLVTVVHIESFSYSGTTWINLLLGCHPRAVALGPPDRVVDQFFTGGGDGHDGCRVHGEQCVLWPRFFATADRARNFYVQVAELLDKDVIVINNVLSGQRAQRELVHPDVLVKRVCVVRDGRSVLASYLKYHPDADFLDSVTGWFAPFAAGLPYDSDNPDVLAVRYEDVVRDQRGFLDAAGAFLDLAYGEDSVRFWEWDHHLIRCNPGPLALLRTHLGLPTGSRDRTQTQERYQRLLRNPHEVTIDELWQRDFGVRERIAFDYFAGEVNARWGYERDRFTFAQLHEFEAAMRAAGLSAEHGATASVAAPRAIAPFAAQRRRRSGARAVLRDLVVLRGQVRRHWRGALVAALGLVVLGAAGVAVAVALAG
ncbi:MAG: hypothetical protein IT495_03885 [Gammaproteobacteria bacterium]|nr:hypothetical protein [Gammaproteobacteria bacterium]